MKDAYVERYLNKRELYNCKRYIIARYHIKNNQTDQIDFSKGYLINHTFDHDPQWRQIFVFPSAVVDMFYILGIHPRQDSKNKHIGFWENEPNIVNAIKKFEQEQNYIKAGLTPDQAKTASRI